MKLKILLLLMGLVFIVISAYAQGDLEKNKSGAVPIADEAAHPKWFIQKSFRRGKKTPLAVLFNVTYWQFKQNYS